MQLAPNRAPRVSCGVHIDVVAARVVPNGLDQPPATIRRNIQSARGRASVVYLADVPSKDGNENFRHDVAQSRRVDPRPTLENLAQRTGLTYEAVVHHALVRYASSGAEALLAVEPLTLRQLISARKAGDWAKVGAIIDWLEAGLESPHWR